MLLLKVLTSLHNSCANTVDINQKILPETFGTLWKCFDTQWSHKVEKYFCMKWIKSFQTHFPTFSSSFCVFSFSAFPLWFSSHDLLTFHPELLHHFAHLTQYLKSDCCVPLGHLYHLVLHPIFLVLFIQFQSVHLQLFILPLHTPYQRDSVESWKTQNF